MNEGTSSGDAVGIKFESLLKLTQTKSQVKNMSLLDYIIKSFIENNERDVLSLSNDLPHCAAACRIHMKDINLIKISLDANRKTCKTELKKMKSEQEATNLSPGVL